jgi:hypothetical protein
LGGRIFVHIVRCSVRRGRPTAVARGDQSQLVMPPMTTELKAGLLALIALAYIVLIEVAAHAIANNTRLAKPC